MTLVLWEEEEADEEGESERRDMEEFIARALLAALGKRVELDGVAEGANALGPLREGLGFVGMQVIGDVVGVVAGGVVRRERVNDDLKAERAVEEGVV